MLQNDYIETDTVRVRTRLTLVDCIYVTYGIAGL